MPAPAAHRQRLNTCGRPPRSNRRQNRRPPHPAEVTTHRRRPCRKDAKFCVPTDGRPLSRGASRRKLSGVQGGEHIRRTAHRSTPRQWRWMKTPAGGSRGRVPLVPGSKDPAGGSLARRGFTGASGHAPVERPSTESTTMMSLDTVENPPPAPVEKEVRGGTPKIPSLPVLRNGRFVNRPYDNWDGQAMMENRSIRPCRSTSCASCPTRTGTDRCAPPCRT